MACVSYDDAIAYVGWLSGHSGHRYRLPSATEWLYAADMAPSLPDGPYGLGVSASAPGSAGEAGGVAEIVGDCWRNGSGVLAVAYRNQTVCLTRTVVDVPTEADQSSGSVLPRLPIAAGASSSSIGFRVVRELD